jgi:phosphoribosylformylglycinamidine synthase
LKIPVSHYEGNYYVDKNTLDKLESKGLIAFRYATPEGEITDSASPNGAIHNIAGVLNEKGNVLGMMPHPERSCEPILGSIDGNFIWESIIADL